MVTDQGALTWIWQSSLDSLPSLIGAALGGRFSSGPTDPSCAPELHCPAPQLGSVKCVCECAGRAEERAECPRVDCRCPAVSGCWYSAVFCTGLVIGFTVCLAGLVCWRVAVQLRRRLVQQPPASPLQERRVPERPILQTLRDDGQLSSRSGSSASLGGAIGDLVTTWQPRRRR